MHSASGRKIFLNILRSATKYCILFLLFARPLARLSPEEDFMEHLARYRRVWRIARFIALPWMKRKFHYDPEICALMLALEERS